ncbi:MAG TPA: retron St85 family RNA-directed DNA polymerase [Buttiauxella sp.]|nr:retron St85 family RNA-directed DNA polymerase [Buttiauxella sp.]
MKIISILAQQLNCSEPEALKLMLEAPYRYRVYTIPKRTHGRRTIAQPTKAIKELQRCYVNYHLFPSHHNSIAYKKGMSIKDNAEAHKKNSYLLKMDLDNFFNSLTPEIFWEVWEKHWSIPDPIERRLIEGILFWNYSSKMILSVGAPSSPVISNFCMYFFDIAVTQHCEKIDVRYTRYADDLTFSTNTPDLLVNMPTIISQILKISFSGKLTVNNQKTIFSSKAHNRHVTGITITNNEKLSIGRERKRYIKHLVNEYKFKKLDSDLIYHLKGLISFASHIEPDFITSLRNKYSPELIDSIIKVS